MIAVRRTTSLSHSARTQQERKTETDRNRLDEETMPRYRRVLFELFALGQLMKEQRKDHDATIAE